tara:strand:+ start:5050 stop:5760 length:711 start_codon:yes stop_codon:yes gene_type:complete
MSSVYVLKKNASMNMTPGGASSVQLNVGGEGKKIDYSEMSPAAAKWGKRARYAAAIPAAWSALSTLAGDGREDLFTSLGQAGLSASATHNIARGALEPAAARFGERRNFKNNPTHYNEKGEYIGPPPPLPTPPPPQNSSGTTPIALPQGNSELTNYTTSEPSEPIEMIQKPDGSFGYPSTDDMNQEAVNQSNLLLNNPVMPPSLDVSNQNNDDAFETSMNFMDQNRKNMNNSNYGQ